MNAIEKIKQLNNHLSQLSTFESNFVSDNFARVMKWGDETNFSEKQVALIDRIYKDRIVENRPPKEKAEG